MAFQVSPGVLVQERDLTRIIPAVSTSIGAFAGQFSKGPLDEVVSISSEQELVDTFGKPDTNNFEYFFSAANFLQYSNSLRVVRAKQGSTQVNAAAGGTGLLIKNKQDYEDNYSTGQGSVGTFAARSAGAWGNNLLVATCPSASAFEQITTTSQQVDQSDLAVGDTSISVDSDATSYLNVGDIIEFSTTGAGVDFTTGEKYKVTSVASTSIGIVQHPRGEGGLISAVADDARIKRRWRYADQVDGAPGTSAYVSTRSGSGDEIHVVVIDEDGEVSGVPGTVLESYSKLSKASDAKTPQGEVNYYPTVISNKSNYIFWMDHNTSGTNWGNAAANTPFTAVDVPTSESLSGGIDGTASTDGELKSGYDLFADADTVDVGLIIAGPSGSSSHIENLITIAENRKDCVVFASPQRSDVVNVANSNTQTSNVTGFFDGIRSSSYVVFDSGYKYCYDRYNDVYRYIPLNGDIAGLAARTDILADAWYSPAGLNRGVIRGAAKLAYNPTKSQRDDLYTSRVNPVATFSGQGTILFGDKTGLSSPSAFDRINVRRLFITLEKAVATASKFQLFEFNDEFTRANFRNIVEPFLREVQGRRGITDFLVVCDETNNTGEVIDRNEFVAEIFVKPARSINFITLSFVATRTGVSFEEVAG
jgi:phage tail sheath protein FI